MVNGQTATGWAGNSNSAWNEWQAAEASNSRLLRENALLRQQLSNWHNLGMKIASREAQTAEFLASEARRRSSAAVGGTGLQLLQHAEADHADGLQRPFGEVPRGAIVSSGILVVLVVAFAMYQWRAFAMASKNEARPLLHKPAGAKRQGSFACLATPLRSTAQRLGLVEYQVEISELLLGNLNSSCGTLSVSVKVGSTGQIFNTHGVSANTATGNFLFFTDEVFQAKIRRMGGLCEFRVIDQDTPMKDCVAMAEVPAATLVDLAVQRKDYFQIDLLEGPWREESRVEMAASAAPESRQRPYLAMRLRDLGSGSCNAFASAAIPKALPGSKCSGSHNSARAARPKHVEWSDEDEDDYAPRA